jgi:hypothetical protein
MDILINEKNETLIKALNDCALACEKCFDASLADQHIAQLGKCIRLTSECAQICRLTQVLIASNSAFGGELVDVCSDACAGCARECEKHDHPHCKICAETCRLCEEACENFAPSTL